MSQEDLIRIRTDTVLSLLLLKEIDIEAYRQAIEKADEVTGTDLALTSAIATADDEPAYSMRDLNRPMLASSMVIPESLNSYLAGHAKVTTDYMRDWPQADEKNKFGEHHPFGFKSSCCPLLHGAAHGDPEYAHHLMRTTHNDCEMMKRSSEQEKRKDVVPIGSDEYLGAPIESQHDLYVRDRNRNSFTDTEEYHADKFNELSKSFGMLPYLFGLEWQTEEQRENFFDLLGDMASAEHYKTPDAQRVANKFQERAGISWGRSVRNWRERFKPMVSWWERSSDRHGPTEPHPGDAESLSHYMAPWVDKNGVNSPEGISPSQTYHWWEPYQHWGGVGRSRHSLNDLLSQSYPNIFNGEWMNDFLIGMTADNALSPNGPHSHGGSHFPKAINEMDPEDPARASLSSGFTPEDNFERRRAMWSHTSNHHHLHPSEIQGTGGRITVPDDPLMLSPLGRSLAAQTDMGGPRIGFGREDHPSSTDEYWNAHNEHFNASDGHIGRVMQQMAQRVMQQFGPEVLNPVGSDDPVAHTIARGNLQQIAAAANHSLLRLPMGESYRTSAPDSSMKKVMGPVGPVSPDSHAVVPPVYVSGDTDAWGHEMPATLTWRFNHEEGGYSFNQADEPFTLLQRTAHEDHVRAVSPSLVGPMSQIAPKEKEVNAISSVDDMGYAHVQTGALQKAEDYEPTGIFGTLIEPAHTVYDLDDLFTIKGFSGEWIVQKMPKGKRMLVKKENKRVDPIELPSKIKKSLKEREGDFTVDAYVEDGLLNVVDLLVHKGTDMSMEPLEDRLNALRTLYHSDEHVHFPMPNSCISTDEEGLGKAVEELGGTGLLIRDATSSFIKGKEVHPKWVHFADEEIAKQFPFGPLPEVMVKGGQVLLAYPGIFEPVIAKGVFDGRYSMDIEEYEGMPTLVKHARTQLKLWGPVAISLLKEGAAAGGTVSSTTGGTHSATHSAPAKRKRSRRRISNGDNLILRAPELLDDSGEREDTAQMMVAARKEVTGDEKAKTSDELCTAIKGLTPKMIEVYGPEYGIERTEEGDKWTVNEAIDDDIIERSPFPRMNSASPDGGAWAGMQADITAPRGPTELTDESATTFGEVSENDEMAEAERPPKPYHLQIRTDPELDGAATIDIEMGRAKLRYPLRSPQEQSDEEEIGPNIDIQGQDEEEVLEEEPEIMA